MTIGTAKVLDISQGVIQHIVRDGYVETPQRRPKQISQFVRSLARRIKESTVPSFRFENEDDMFLVLSRLKRTIIRAEVKIGDKSMSLIRHINQPSSCCFQEPIGGFISETVKASPEAYISQLTMIIGDVIVEDGAIVMGLRLINGNGITIRKRDPEDEMLWSIY